MRIRSNHHTASRFEFVLGRLFAAAGTNAFGRGLRSRRGLGGRFLAGWLFAWKILGILVNTGAEPGIHSRRQRNRIVAEFFAHFIDGGERSAPLFRIRFITSGLTNITICILAFRSITSLWVAGPVFARCRREKSISALPMAR